MKKLNLKKLINNLIYVPEIIDVILEIEDGEELRQYKDKLHDEFFELLGDNDFNNFIDETYNNEIVLKACESVLDKNAKMFFSLGVLQTDILEGGNSYSVDDETIDLDSTELKIEEHGRYGLYVFKSNEDKLIYENGYCEDYWSGPEYYKLNFEHDTLANLVYKSIDEKEIWE